MAVENCDKNKNGVKKREIRLRISHANQLITQAERLNESWLSDVRFRFDILILSNLAEKNINEAIKLADEIEE